MDKCSAAKKFSRNHLSAYKGQGIKGDLFANRLLRANRVQEERKKSRVDEMNKRRRLPMSPLQDINVTVSETSMNSNKEHDHCSKNMQLGNNRKEQLKKWREEKKLKQQMEVLNNGNAKKRNFMVGQVKYKAPPTFVKKNSPEPIKKEKAVKKEPPTRRLTRASARLAQKQVSAKPRSPVRKLLQNKTTKFTKLDKEEQKISKSETQTTRSAVKSSKPPNNQVRTRAQLKKIKEERTLKKTDKQETQPTGTEDILEKMEEKPSDEEVPLTIEKVQQATFPQFETVRDTISFGRGSTEGVKRSVQQVLTPVTEATFEPQSFAPMDFKFSVPSGVNSFLYSAENFTFEPLSPHSANAFLFPSSASFYSSPQALAIIPATEEERKGNEMEGNFSGNKTTNAAVKETKLEVVQESGDALKNDECVVTITRYQLDRVNPAESNSVCAGVKSGDSCNTVLTGTDSNSAHDSVYFRNLVKSETAKLNCLCDKWDALSTSTMDLTEEVQGQIRTVVGQAQLLIDQRFKQFSGLIDLSENKTAEKKATSSDLQGFWEMIYFQVEDVIVKFENLDKLKANDWKEEMKQVNKRAPGKKLKNKPAETNGPSKGKGAKNRLQEMRAAMKAKMKEQKAKMASEKSSDQTEDLAFFTILTPVERKTCSDEVQDVVLTPVRRSARKTPKPQSVCIVSTPKLQNDATAALRFTPEAASPGQLKEHVLEEEQKAIADVTMKSDTAVTTDNDTGDKGEEVSVTTRQLHGRMVTRRKSSVSFAPNSQVKRMKRTPGNTSRRRSSMRNRVPTPYYPGKSSSRTKNKDNLVETDSSRAAEEAGTPVSSQNDITTTLNGSIKKPVSPGCQSVGKTPSTFKLQSPTALDSSPLCDKLPSDVSVDLFGKNCKLDSATDIDDFSSKYLCPTKSGDESSNIEPDRESTNVDCFQNNTCQMSDDSLISPETVPKVSLIGSEPWRWRTPVNLISCLSDIDTPSPSSLPITPMPLKTTWFISPLQNNEEKVTPYIPDSPASPGEERVTGGSLLVPVTPEVIKPKENHSKIAFKLKTFHIQSPARTLDQRRDSVFFAPITDDAGYGKANSAESANNLISFSPDITKDASNKENLACGSMKRFAAITPSKKVRNFLGAGCVLSPVRRSARLHMDDSSSVTSLQVASVSQLPSNLDFGYQPNPSLTNI